MTTDGEFNVFWWDPAGNCHVEQQWLDAESAVRLVERMLRRPAAHFGIFKKIMITEGHDYACFEWKHGKGITYPPKDQLSGVTPKNGQAQDE
jgi:hypothetical protein